jgi:predicted P-loop ATPase
MLIAAVRRVRQPGCKFDEIPVLEGPQGENKSTALSILAHSQDWFLDDLPLTADSKKVIEQTAGKWIVEASDLSGMRKADIEHVKALASRQVDRSRMAYGRRPMERPRQFIIIGTTNSSKYLKDLSGNRRFWPVKVTKFDIDALRRDCDQLWAEAAVREKAGESIRLDQSLWPNAAAEQLERTAEDPWIEALEEAIGNEIDGLKGKILASDAWVIVNLDAGRRTQDQNARIGHAMKSLGFERKKLQFDSKPKWGYARGSLEEQKKRICIERSPSGRIVAALSQEEAERRASEVDPWITEDEE